MNQLVQKIEDFLCGHGIDQNAKILIAFSGGPDSMALLSLFSRLTPQWNFQLTALHIEHGLRPVAEAELDMQFVLKMQTEFNIPVYIERIKKGRIHKLAADEGRSLEEVARSLRYEIFELYTKRFHCDYVATGHNRDDQLETMVQRFFQGSGVDGLKGIPAVRGTIIRPLLGCAKDELLAYLREEGRIFRLDKTNLEDRFLRNRIRHRLIPVLAEIFPGFRTALSHLQEKMVYASDFINREVKAKLPWTACRGGYSIDYETFMGAAEVLKMGSLYSLFTLFRAQRGKADGRLSYRMIKTLVKREKTTAKNSILYQGKGFRLEKRDKQLFWLADIVLSTKKSYLIQAQPKVNYEIFDIMSFHYQYSLVSSLLEEGSLVWEEEITPPLIIRSRIPGDRIDLEVGGKSIKKLFNEWGVPRYKRWQIPIIVDRKGIIAIGGKPFGYANRLRRKERKKVGNKKKEALLFTFDVYENDVYENSGV